MATLTGRTAELDDVGLIPGLIDSRGSLWYSWFVPFLLHLACEFVTFITLDYIRTIFLQAREVCVCVWWGGGFGFRFGFQLLWTQVE